MLEYKRLKQNDLFSTIKRNAISGDTVTVLVHNVRSLPKHVDNIVIYNRIINNDIIGFTKTQIQPSDSTCKIIETSNLFNINFYNIRNKLLSLTYGCRHNVAVLNVFEYLCIYLKFQETCFCQQSIHFNVDRKQSIHMQKNFQMSQ